MGMGFSFLVILRRLGALQLPEGQTQDKLVSRWAQQQDNVRKANVGPAAW